MGEVSVGQFVAANFWLVLGVAVVLAGVTAAIVGGREERIGDN